MSEIGFSDNVCPFSRAKLGARTDLSFFHLGGMVSVFQADTFSVLMAAVETLPIAKQGKREHRLPEHNAAIYFYLSRPE